MGDFGNTNDDLGAQLYGVPPPSLADTALLPPVDPWGWVPDHWNNEDDQLRRAGLRPQGAPIAEHVGPDDAPAPGSELATAAPEVAPGPALPGTGIPLPLADAALRMPPEPLAAIPEGLPGGEPPPVPQVGTSATPLPPIEPEQLDRASTPIPLADQWNSDPLHAPDELARMAIERASPEQLAELQRAQSVARQTKLLADEARANEDNLQQLKQNVAIRQAADARTGAEMQRIMADAQQLAATKIDPNRWMSTRSGGQRLAAYLLAIGGGLLQGLKGGGRNIGMDMIQKEIDQDIDAQKQDIETGKYGIGVRQNAVAQEYARTGNLFQAAESVRLATYQAAINKMQTEQQNFDPQGTSWLTYGAQIQDLHARMAAHIEKIGNERAEYNLKSIKEIRENAVAQATIDKYEAEAAKLRGGTGAGGATNPNYTVATGFFNPFTQSPVMGKRAIGGKGQEKEHDQIAAQISTYGHVQDYWAKLKAIGDEIGNAKTLGESIWSARKGTLGAEYDAAREALTVYLTKELGDKLTQGQLEAQQHRIPERAGVFEARDPGAQIRAAQEDADRDFSRDMSLVGIDPTPIIQAAQGRRQPAPEPGARDAYLAAQQAQSTARTPTERKDAAAAAAAAQQKLQEEAAAAKQSESDVAYASGLAQANKVAPTIPQIFIDFPQGGDRAASQAAMLAANESAKFYNEQLTRFGTQLKSPAAKGKPGDVAAAKKAHDATLGQSAHELLAAHDAFIAKYAEARRLNPSVPDPDAAKQPAPGMGDIPKAVPGEFQ